jgi:glyoxylase-like metal-dependent hydrolase (beta-lactamase superfamily II)
MANHVCYALREEKTLFTGDHVMGWSTSIIAPPDGNMQDYMDSLARLLTRDDEVYWPTHGPCIPNPKEFVEGYIQHRQNREHQVLARLAAGDTRITAMVEVMYADIDKKLHPAAALSVFAHMQDLVARKRVACSGKPALDSEFTLV